MSTNEMTKGQEKRLAKKQAAAALKRKKTIRKIIWAVIAVAVVAVIAVVIVKAINKKNNEVTPVYDLSAGLNDQGFIDGFNAADNVTTIDPASLTVAYADIAAKDEDIQTQIDSALSANKYYSEDTSLVIADGDSINLDYVGSVDGVEFEGGNTNGEGTTLTIGSGSYVDTFEEQLIGHKPGDEVTVNVTFPDTYTQNPDLAGKAAVFQCKINSIQVTPELTDEFVAEKLSDQSNGAKTAEEFRTYIKETIETSNLKTNIQSQITEQTKVSKYPKSYVKTVKSILYANEIQTCNYYNNLYEQFTGSARYSTFADYLTDSKSMTEDEYFASLVDDAEKNVASQLAYEVLFNKLGLSISDADYTAQVANLGDDAENTYGKPYIMMTLIVDKTMTKLTEIATITR